MPFTESDSCAEACAAIFSHRATKRIGGHGRVTGGASFLRANGFRGRRCSRGRAKRRGRDRLYLEIREIGRQHRPIRLSLFGHNILIRKS